MTKSSEQRFWFDTSALTQRDPDESAALTPSPRAVPTRTGLGRLLPAGLRPSSAAGDEDVPEAPSGANLIEAFAAANGFDYRLVTTREQRDRPGLILDGTCEDVVSYGSVHDTDAAYVEFGNHGWRYWIGEGRTPVRRGYIAIRHDLDLPQVFLESRSLGAASVGNVLSIAVGFAGIFSGLEESGGGYTQSALGRFQGKSRMLHLPEARNFGASTAKKHAHEASTLLSGDALRALSEVARSFDVELNGRWLFAYGYFGDLSTKDPDVWAWAFSTASRLFEALEAWGSRSAAAHRELAFTTPEHLVRPEQLDGALSQVLPKRRGKVGTFMFGRAPE